MIGKLGGVRFGERAGARLGDEQIDGAEILGNLVGKAEHVHRRRKRRRELAQLLLEGFVAAADDDELDRKLCARERERGREQLAAAFAAGHQHHDRQVGRETERRAEFALLPVTSSNFGWIGWPSRCRRDVGTPRESAR